MSPQLDKYVWAALSEKPIIVEIFAFLFVYKEIVKVEQMTSDNKCNV